MRDLEVSLLIFNNNSRQIEIFVFLFHLFREKKNKRITHLIFIFFQLILLEESWSELFLLWAVQCSASLDNGGPLFTTALNRYQIENENGKSVHRLLNDLLSRFKQLKLDPIEYACLKAIVLFRFGKKF